MMREALAYAAHGWPVFVLSPQKKPVKNCAECDPQNKNYVPHKIGTCGHLTCHGFYAATRDPYRIGEMIQRHPRGCLAVRTGAESGLAVVDVDVETDNLSDPGLKSLAELDRQQLLPGTVTAITGSGGLHLLYAHPGGYVMSGAHKYGHRIDSKGDGGYIVVAPSLHPRTKAPYRWSGNGRFDYELPVLPEALCARVRPPKNAPRPGSVWDQFAHHATVRDRLGGILRILLDTKATGGNDMLYWASKKVGVMVAAGEIDQTSAVAALQQAAREIGLPESSIGHEGKGTIGSGLRNGKAGG